MERKILAVAAAACLANCTFAQQVILDNLSNSGALSATSGGLVYVVCDVGVGAPTLFDGSQYDLGVTVWGGPDAGSLTSMGTFTPANDPKGYTGFSGGTFQLGPAGLAVTVPGVSAGGMATIELQIWDYDSPHSTGTFSSYAAALAGGDPTATVTFQNPTSNLSAAPPIPAPDLVGMPSVSFWVVCPEPPMSALAGLGLVSLLVFRRRKQI